MDVSQRATDTIRRLSTADLVVLWEMCQSVEDGRSYLTWQKMQEQEVADMLRQERDNVHVFWEQLKLAWSQRSPEDLTVSQVDGIFVFTRILVFWERWRNMPLTIDFVKRRLGILFSSDSEIPVEIRSPSEDDGRSLRHFLEDVVAVGGGIYVDLAEAKAYIGDEERLLMYMMDSEPECSHLEESSLIAGIDSSSFTQASPSAANGESEKRGRIYVEKVSVWLLHLVSF